MIIETEPCESCDFTPSVCGCDIELCMMNQKIKLIMVSILTIH
jgi:hypothetical protein